MPKSKNKSSDRREMRPNPPSCRVQSLFLSPEKNKHSQKKICVAKHNPKDRPENTPFKLLLDVHPYITDKEITKVLSHNRYKYKRTLKLILAKTNKLTYSSFLLAQERLALLLQPWLYITQKWRFKSWLGYGRV